MPISLTPSRRSQKTWGNLSSHPIRYDISALALAQLALIFNLATAAWDAGNQHNTMYRWSSGLMSAEITVRVAPPLATMALAASSIYMHSERCLAPGLAVSYCVVAMLGWVFAVYWGVTDVLLDHGDGIDGARMTTWVRAITCVLSGLETILYLAYLYHASKATHRHRRALRNPSPTPSLSTSPTALELRTRTRSASTSAVDSDSNSSNRGLPGSSAAMAQGGTGARSGVVAVEMV